MCLLVDAPVNSSGTVLSVNNTGDVILVPDNPGTGADADWFRVGTTVPPNAIPM